MSQQDSRIYRMLKNLGFELAEESGRKYLTNLKGPRHEWIPVRVDVRTGTQMSSSGQFWVGTRLKEATKVIFWPTPFQKLYIIDAEYLRGIEQRHEKTNQYESEDRWLLDFFPDEDSFMPQKSGTRYDLKNYVFPFTWSEQGV